jgi:hypothetical protein
MTSRRLIPAFFTSTRLNAIARSMKCDEAISRNGRKSTQEIASFRP